MFASSPNPLIELNSTELGSHWAKQFGVQKYRLNFLIGGSVKNYRHIWVNTFSALHSLPISLKYFLSSRLYPVINITVINEPVNSDEVGNRASTEYANMEAFGIDFPIFIAIILSIASSAHILFYIEVIERALKLIFNTSINFHFIPRRTHVEPKLSNT